MRPLLLVLGLIAVVTPDLAHAQRFHSSGSIVINDFNVATPYPSSIVVPAGLGNGGVVTDLTVTLLNVRHSCYRDLDILLVPPPGPGRKPILLMSDAGDCTGVAQTATFWFNDRAANPMPDRAPLFDNVLYSPTDYASNPDVFPNVSMPNGVTNVLSMSGDPAGEW